VAPAVPLRYAFRSETGPCRKVVVDSGKKIVASCLGALGFSLDEAVQSALEVTLAFAGGHRHCGRFSGPLMDEPGVFIAKDSPGAPCAD
jgi:hypothetical protein